MPDTSLAVFDGVGRGNGDWLCRRAKPEHGRLRRRKESSRAGEQWKEKCGPATEVSPYFLAPLQGLDGDFKQFVFGGFGPLIVFEFVGDCWEFVWHFG